VVDIKKHVVFCEVGN